MDVSQAVAQCLIQAKTLAYEQNHEYVTPEHLLHAMCDDSQFQHALMECGGEPIALQDTLEEYFEEYLEDIEEIEAEDEEEPITPMESFGLQQILLHASAQVLNSEKNTICIDHIFFGFTQLKDSYATYFIEQQGVEQLELLMALCESYEGQMMKLATEAKVESDDSAQSAYIVDLMQQEETILVGRDEIIQRTLQVLCRKQKNNPIHMGEPGVGKTAIVKGLVGYIKEGKVPAQLKNAYVVELDLGGMLAGTQYRGDLEKRLKHTLESLQKYEKPIVYIDEIHNIVGAGAIGSGSLDAANLLKPYLAEGNIRFIGSTTFEEYKKNIEKDKGLVRRFQPVEVKEPSIEESLQILQGLQESYEKYHHVTYTAEAIEAAVKLSARYMNERFLPDKAIDLMDEAGAYVSMKEQVNAVVTEEVIEKLIATMCQIPPKSVEIDERKQLKDLEKVIKTKVFGQDEVVDKVVRSIKLSRAGLSNSQKPVASMLFVGPTGVGKTELAKVLANQLGIELVRFDMSEYTEKHTASKLIGSPPGYVGYDEGGLLTDAVRKTPHCVLLLDEIEKAHSDIFNMLLQVMDYATLTDSHGKKADFRNVILLMTSNAGASRIGKQLVGFGERTLLEDTMAEEVKKVFTPEFRNRLNGIISFKHLDEARAKDIAKKALDEMKTQLTGQNIQLSFNKACIEYVAQKGVSKEFGAREIARVIENEVSPLLVDEILFGRLKDGGKCQLGCSKGVLKLTVK